MILSESRLRWFAIGAAGLMLSMSLYFLQASGFHEKKRSPATGQGTGDAAPSTGMSEQLPPTLHVTSIVQHGRIVEIEGMAEAGSVVMINGQPAATIFEGNVFRHFVGPLPSGTSIVSITSQNDKGGVNTQQLAVTVE